MTKEHKQLLNDNRKMLVENMIPYDVLNLLLSRQVLSCGNVAYVNEKDIINDMNECLLDVLLRKPDRAFKEFVKALHSTGQNHIAKLLEKRGETV